MIVRFTRLNPTHHRFEIIRDDGSRDMRELETRSLLTHDLVHFALESEGGLQHGFYGALARGALRNRGGDGDRVRRRPLQGLLKGEFDPETFVERFRAVRENTEARMPDWLTADLIARVTDRYRRLQGQWREGSVRSGDGVEFKLLKRQAARTASTRRTDWPPEEEHAFFLQLIGRSIGAMPEIHIEGQRSTPVRTSSNISGVGKSGAIHWRSSGG